MLTSEIKSSIRSLGVQKNSINLQIIDLGKTKETIENLSEQIKTNVTELNNTITKLDRFKLLTNEVEKQIARKLLEIKEMNKTQEITKALEQSVKILGEEAQKKLVEVRQSIQKHEQDFKEKICQQVQEIKSVLQQLDNNVGKGMMQDLKVKIQDLVGKGEGVTNGGKLGKLLIGINSISRMGQLEWDQVFNEGVPIRNAPDVMSAVRNIKSQKSYYQSYVNGAVSALLEIQKRLKEFEEGNVISEIRCYNEASIDEYKNKIKDHQDYLWKLELMEGPYGSYKLRLSKMKTLIKHLNSLKLKENEDKLTDKIQGIVKKMDDIQYSELTLIDGDIDHIINKAKTAQRHLRNTEKMYTYLEAIVKQKEKITNLSIKETRLEQIEATIGEVSKAGAAIKEAKEEIGKGKQKLQSGLQLDPSKGRHVQTSNAEKEKLMTEELDLNGDEGKFKEYQRKLEGIKSFNETLKQVKDEMNSFPGESQRSDGSDVGGVLSWLEKIDKTLTEVYRSTESAV